MKRWLLIFGLLVLVFGILAGIIGQVATRHPLQPMPPQVMRAQRTANAIVVDGLLDEPAWQRAKAYAMCYSRAEARKPGRFLHEGAKVRLVWDLNYLYVGVELTDLDIVAEGTIDQLHHYNFGDVLEVFLKPENKPWYVELYATPGNYKTWFFYSQRGAPIQTEDIRGFKVKAQCHGTLNKGTDIDELWSVEMAIPVSALKARGDSFGLDSQWRVLVARYNYSRQLPIPWLEYSMVPSLKWTDFHLLSGYALLQLEP